MIRSAADTPKTPETQPPVAEASETGRDQTTPSPTFSNKDVRSPSPEVVSKLDRLQPANRGAGLDVKAAKTEKVHLCRMLDDYNDSEQVMDETELMACLHQHYEKGMKHCHFASHSLESVVQASSVSEQDAGLLLAIRQQLGSTEYKRSRAIARMTCWLAKDSNRINVIEHHSHYLCSGDMVYIACHSSPTVAAHIIENHLARLNPVEISAIADVHPDLIKMLVVNGRCWQEPDDWPLLLRLALKDPELGDDVFSQKVPVSYISYSHRALLAAQSDAAGLERANILFTELTSLLDSHMGEPCGYDEQVAWRLLMRHKSIAESWLQWARLAMTEDIQPILEAEILAHHIGLKNQYDFNIPAILDDPYAAAMLLNRQLMFLLGDRVVRTHINHKMSDQDKLELLSNNANVAIAILPHEGTFTLNGISSFVNQYASTSGQAICHYRYMNLGPASMHELHTCLKNPMALAYMRHHPEHFDQQSTPYPDAVELLSNPMRMADLQRTERLQSAYPSLVALRQKKATEYPYLAVDKMTLMAASDRSPGLVGQIMNSEDFSDQEKLQAAGKFESTLKEMLERPERFLTKPSLLQNQTELMGVLKRVNQKRNAIGAIQSGLLNDWTGEALFELCVAHPEFAEALVESPALLAKVPVMFVRELCRSNPSLYAAVIACPALDDYKAEIQLYDEEGDTFASFHTASSFVQPQPDKSDQTSAFMGAEPVVFDAQWQEDFIHQSESLLNEVEGGRKLKPEYFPFHQMDLIGNHPERMRGGGVCRGVCLDYAVWQSSHPEAYPIDYMRKLAYYRDANSDSLHHKSLPERLDFLQRQHGLFIDAGEVINSADDVVQLDLELLEDRLREERFLLLTQEQHGCALALWDDPDSDGGQRLVVLDPGQGMFCFVGCFSDQPWSKAIQNYLDEAIKTAMLCYGKDVCIKVHTIDREAISENYATAIRYKNKAEGV